MKIRACERGDVAAICGIYNYYIEHTVITFEESVLTEADMGARVAAYTRSHPWLVCEADGEICGFAYATTWKERSAYRFTAESTVYLRQGLSRKGYGKALYGQLLADLQTQGCHVVLGCIALPNDASVGLHEYFGFARVAHFPEVGRKFERWLDVGYWAKQLRD